MNAMKLLSALVCVALSVATAHAADDTTILTFDDISVGFDHIPMPQGYGNLQWSNFRVVNGWNQPWNSGYRTGMVSPNNVAFNPFGDPAAIGSANLFDLDSAYLTAGVLNALQIQIQGYVGTTLAYDTTYTVNVTDAGHQHGLPVLSSLRDAINHRSIAEGFIIAKLLCAAKSGHAALNSNAESETAD
jgi:hypothetical protein